MAVPTEALRAQPRDVAEGEEELLSAWERVPCAPRQRGLRLVTQGTATQFRLQLSGAR